MSKYITNACLRANDSIKGATTHRSLVGSFITPSLRNIALRGNIKPPVTSSGDTEMSEIISSGHSDLKEQHLKQICASK